jgi:hypothetical protein
MREMRTRIKILTATLDDEEEVAALERQIEAMTDNEADVKWLQSSSCEGSDGHTAMFTQITAVVTWKEE